MLQQIYRYLVLLLAGSLALFSIGCRETDGQLIALVDTIDAQLVKYRTVVMSPVATPTTLVMTNTLTSNATRGYATTSPDGKTIAFVVPLACCPSEEVYIIDKVRKQHTLIFQQQMAHTDGPFAPAIWSPDSRYFLFQDHRSYIHVVNRETHHRIELPYYGISPAWSPDSNRILFVHWENRQSVIAVIDLDGENYTKLTDPMARLDHLTWSPDGSQIAFTSHQLVDEGMWGQQIPSVAAELMVMNSDGQQLKQLTNLNQPIGKSVWSNDGLEITFPIMQDEIQKAIYTIGRDGTNLRLRLTDD